MTSNVSSEVDQTGPIPASPAVTTFEAHPMVYVVRFCGDYSSSISAAIGQAIGVLDTYLQEAGLPEARQMFVTYRNHIEGAVTVHVGYPVTDAAAASAAGEISAGTTPAGPMVEFSGEDALEQVLAIGHNLPESATSYTWQVYEADEFRPWTGHLVESLLMPADLWPHVQRYLSQKAGEA